MPDPSGTGLLQAIANGALTYPNILQAFANGAPLAVDGQQTVINTDPQGPGATALIPGQLAQGPPALPSPDDPRAIQAARAAADGNVPFAPPVPPRQVVPYNFQPADLSQRLTATQIGNIVYGETGGQTQTPGGPSLDDLRNAMANAILNGHEQRKRPPQTVSDTLKGPQLSAILSPTNPAAMNAWLSSFNAGLAALQRISAPTTGPGSATNFNGRTDDSTAPNTGRAKHPHAPWPFRGNFGPYDHSNGNPYWAFFGQSGK